MRKRWDVLMVRETYFLNLIFAGASIMFLFTEIWAYGLETTREY